jgi:murein DD-endopeptidase MepM/ murein hydrolase activator NlpD
MDNPNEVFSTNQGSYEPLNALLRAKGKLALVKRSQAQKSQETPVQSEPQMPQVELPQTANPSGQMTSPFDQKFRVSQGYDVSNPALYKGVTADAKHHGVDFATPEGTAIKSPIAGKVEVGQNKWYGNYVKIKADDGTEIQFSHLSNVDDLLKQIDEKQRVLAGQLVGLSGNTG